MATTIGALRTSADLRAAREARSRQEMLADPVVRGSAVVAVCWVLAFAVLTQLLADSEAGRRWLGSVLYLVPVAVAAGLSGVAAVRSSGRTRRFWVVLTASNGLWLSGELVWGWYEFRSGGAPFPSVADGFYLSSYALVVVAVVLGFGAGWLRVSRSLLDASVVAVAVGLLGWQTLIEPQLAFGASLGTTVGVAYPLLGVVILVLVGVLGYGSHRQVPLSAGLVAVAFAVSAATDVAYTHTVVLHDYASGGWLNLGWQAEAVMLAVAALAAARHAERGEVDASALRRDGALPLLLVGTLLTAAMTLADARNGEVSLAVGGLALFTLAAVGVRLTLTVHEKELAARRLQDALTEQERLAITDGLTGLHNRRFAEEMLRLEAERCERTGRPLSVVVLDADHFKQVNDTYGHPTGDVVLREIAQRLLACARPSDVVARYGGEEFVLLLPEVDSEGATEIAERCRRAIDREPVHVDGHRIAMSISLGVACVPEHARDVQALLRTADQSLYLAKDLGRNRVQTGLANVETAPDPLPASDTLAFLTNLADRVDALQSTSEHAAAVGRWASAVADALGLGAQAQQDCLWAGRLHDIGKVQVPEAVLLKPGPLDDDEWRLMRQHPRAGADLLLMLPGMAHIAQIVGQHHERVDGGGYPNGLTAPDILIEARIVAVADAYAAMRAQRPYQQPRSAGEARRVLLAGAGTQWDALVVHSFLQLLDTGALEDLGLLEPHRAAPVALVSG